MMAAHSMASKTINRYVNLPSLFNSVMLQAAVVDLRKLTKHGVSDVTVHSKMPTTLSCVIAGEHGIVTCSSGR